MMNTSSNIPLSDLPEDDLKFFHGLSNWIEQTKTTKPVITDWNTGYKLLTKLNFLKYPKGENIQRPTDIADNTIFILCKPNYKYAFFILRQIRNAFCHNGLIYDNDTKQYRIVFPNNLVKIAGQFSLEGIYEFVSIFLSKQ